MSLSKILQMSLVFLLSYLTGVSLFAQSNNFSFHPIFSNQTLKSELYYKINITDSVQITSLKFYISNLELINGTKTVWEDKVKYHLVDAFDEKTLVLQIPSNSNFTKIKFQLGIDSLTNVSGAMGGDLDPTKGMYWTWQSGYINFKLEGNSNLCSTRHHEFQFHLGGYQYPFNCLQTVFIPMKSSGNITLHMDVAKFIEQLSLSQLNHIMSPSKEAVDLAEKITETFSISYE